MRKSKLFVMKKQKTAGVLMWRKSSLVGKYGDMQVLVRILPPTMHNIMSEMLKEVKNDRSGYRQYWISKANLGRGL